MIERVQSNCKTYPTHIKSLTNIDICIKQSHILYILILSSKSDRWNLKGLFSIDQSLHWLCRSVSHHKPESNHSCTDIMRGKCCFNRRLSWYTLPRLQETEIQVLLEIFYLAIIQKYRVTTNNPEENPKPKNF